ncbi:MAG: ATP-grasp domain-containing protein [Gammaproteobacteria bacterium]|nr:ATP-grasp domain-containing protein [Gammaproteobacteria bacterium]NNF61711.1 ATP-grasp domain-containing protein [Gammaproteobacteria bacterium]NNM21766.1 ATP-grasp domain-containing protein [Gammaproteobacteria bacterium]
MVQSTASKASVWVPDEMFARAERDARDYSVFPGNRPPSASAPIQGLVTSEYCHARAEELQDLAVDQYIAEVLEPAEMPKRPSARQIVKKLKGKVLEEVSNGPLYAVEIELACEAGPRRVGILAQNREVSNGVWGPEHHLQAVELVRNFSDLAMPIVTFMDTPGADAGADANKNNQAHTISRLLAEMCNLHVPTVGIVYGLGFSGGAIPLAATNVLLCVRTAVFNTIQPKGLASIARQYNLSWQECARYVGLSSYELLTKGVIDGVIDFVPDDKDADIEPLQRAICSSIDSIEQTSRLFTAQEPAVLGQYQRAVNRFLHPSPELKKIKSVSAFSFSDARRAVPDVFGLSMRHLRYIGLRRRLRTSTLEAYGRLAEVEIPAGDLQERTRQTREKAFTEWLQDPDRIVYNEQLAKALKTYRQRRDGLAKDRGRLTSLLLGEPQRNYENAREALCFNLGLYLYNRWKTASPYNFRRLIEMLATKEHRRSGDEIGDIPDTEVTVRDVIFDGELRRTLTRHFVNLLIFDALYDSIVNGFADIAEEARRDHSISKELLQKILESSLQTASRQVQSDAGMDETGKFMSANSDLFSDWIRYFIKFSGRGAFLKEVEEWKRVAFTRLSDALLVLITFIFETLVPGFFDAQTSNKSYDGKIKPKRIGKRKDFWNQLEIAYNDVLVQRVLDDLKKQKLTTVDAIKDRFFTDFQELNANLMTADPVNFPGFRLSIERALKKGETPCGVITGIANLAFGSRRKVGVLISNTAFQAGAFDMAASEKLSRLLNECVSQRLPVICFVSSGGMQTKEGPNALFAMAISNDRITRFVRDNDLPIIVFGFGDCTGGSQASFVTHPMAQTYYFSGCNMPFAGRVVVPSFLPSQYIVSNYLSANPDSMRGLVHHPFAPDLDDRLREIDPQIPLPTESVEEVVERIFRGGYLPEARKSEETDTRSYVRSLMQPINRVLIHARGCTAVKLVRIAKRRGTTVVLVQSDPDMDSVAADMLTGADEVVSLGGQTPDESYLNAMSVFAIASRERVDALHPGIGFLSENEEFARTCRKRGLNFVGPYAKNMEVMGNKSNAINTAIANKVPVVPGSHGILTSAGATEQVAENVGYPVLLKAVHGGGGKGIKIVRSADRIRDAFATVYAEAKSAFGSGDLYLEKFVESLRHIEVQILRDFHGNTRILGLRDCSVQRNNQKILEESESVRLPERLELDAYQYARDLANAIDYLGAGTVEFIYDLRENALYFMEMNTRLQVEHPVTEWTTGISIVDQQFRIAEGGSIEDMEVTRNGYSIEARINAEKGVFDADGSIDLMPSPGTVTECHFPADDDIEVIATVAKGKSVSPFYDSMVAQVIAYGSDRRDGIEKLRRYLESVQIQGICTNIPLLTRILGDTTFQKGQYDTTYLPEFLSRTDGDRLVAEMAQTGATAGSETSIEIDGSDELKVLAPQTGIFYATPSPSEPAYVSVGDRVTLDETLCQIEAMKMFTSVSLASFNGTQQVYPERQYEVVRINQANGAQVNADDLLFVVKPV